MSAIGIFDSGYGGLTVMKEIQATMPDYDYIYLGDNSRAPYGNKSFETVYQYTLECVQWLWAQDCPLIILACNTASARALRTIQEEIVNGQNLKQRVLGVIRPTAEIVGSYSKSGTVGILGTTGTVISNTYPTEIHKYYPALTVVQKACPLWVPLIETDEYAGEDAEHIVAKDVEIFLEEHKKMDTLLLACTHYPLLLPIIEKYVGKQIKVISQGSIVAESLKKYLQNHPEITENLTKFGQRTFYTTDDVALFEAKSSQYYGQKIAALKAKV